MKYRVGIDIGGTFTDIVLLGDDGSLRNCKVLTTPDDFGRAIASGLGRMIATLGVKPEQIDMLIYATLSPDVTFPGSGVFTQRQLGLGPIAVLDIRQ